MEREIIRTSDAPIPGGPYSQAVKAGGFVFVAGQVAIKPGAREFAEGGVEGQTRQVLQNINAILRAAGSSLEKVVKATVYLKSMDDFSAMNKVYQEFFTNDPPARATVAVDMVRGAMVEIECVAIA